MKTKLLVLMLSVSATCALATAAVGAPPTITVGESVGANPATVYTAGQTTRVVNVAWDAGADYTYCEIYYTVNNASQAELGRGHDGVKQITVTAGSSYEIWMVIYPGNGQYNVVTTLNLVARQGGQTPPPPPPPTGAGGGGVGTGANDPIARKRDGGALSTLAISNVRIESGPRHIIMRFRGPPNQMPYVAIGRAAPIMTNGELVFGDNLVGGGFVGPGTVTDAEKAKGEYMFASAFGTTIGEDGLDPGRTYYYLINIPAGPGRKPYQDTDKFTMRGERTTVRVVWERVLILDDSDDLSTGEVNLWFWANFGQPGAKFSGYSNGDVDSGRGYDIGESITIENAPNILSLSASGRDDDSNAFNSNFVEAGVPSPLNGPADKGAADENVAKSDFDLTKSPGTNVTVPFVLNALPGGSLNFTIFGRLEITRGPGEQLGTASSRLETSDEAGSIRPQGRVRLPDGTPRRPPLPICEAARQARERNSPAAPGLEARCRAEGGLRPQGRVQLPQGSTRNSPMPICDAARQARARNSPAAPGLEAKCLTINKGEAIANQDPLAVELSSQQPDDRARDGFNFGMALAEGQTAPGPGKDRACANLSSREEQDGCRAAVQFSVERNRNAVLARRGAAIVETDPEVAEFRNANTDVFYRLGFDIGLAASEGHTLPGPGKDKIRDSLAPALRAGFIAAVGFTLERNRLRR